MRTKRDEKDRLGIALVKYVCPICGRPKEELQKIMMNQRLTFKSADKIREMNGQVVGIADRPCDECQSVLDQGAMIVIGIDVDKSDMENKDYYRSGHLVGVKRESGFVKGLPEHAREKDAIFMDYREMRRLGMLNEME